MVSPLISVSAAASRGGVRLRDGAGAVQAGGHRGAGPERPSLAGDVGWVWYFICLTTRGLVSFPAMLCWEEPLVSQGLNPSLDIAVSS